MRHQVWHVNLGRRRGWLLLVLGAAISVSCQDGAPRHQVDERNIGQERIAIDRTREAYQAAWRAGNAQQIAGLYTEDAVVMYPNQPAVSGTAAITAYFTTFFDEFVQQSFSLTSLEVEVVGDWAFDRGAYSWKATPKAGGQPIEDHGKYLVVLRRQADGSWKVARDIDNSDRPLTQKTRSDG